MNFPGKRDPLTGGVKHCDLCDEVAIYRGAAIKDNFRHYFHLCIFHGKESLYETKLVTHIELYKEFKEWERKRLIEEAKQRHPASEPSPQLRLVIDNE